MQNETHAVVQPVIQTSERSTAQSSAGQPAVLAASFLVAAVRRLTLTLRSLRLGAAQQSRQLGWADAVIGSLNQVQHLHSCLLRKSRHQRLRLRTPAVLRAEMRELARDGSAFQVQQPADQ
jgi:ribosomal protein L30/L7E